MKLEGLAGRPFYDLILSFIPDTFEVGEDKDKDVALIKAGIEVLKRTGVNDLVNILWCGMYGGARKQRKDFSLSIEDLVDELDDHGDPLPVLNQALAMAFSSLPVADKGQKKTT